MKTTIESYTDKQGKLRTRVKAENGNIIGPTQGFHNRLDMEESLKRYAYAILEHYGDYGNAHEVIFERV